jgi:hypothetical protein
MGARIAQLDSARLRPGSSVVQVPAGAGNFSLHHRVHRPPIQRVPGDLFLGLNRPRREADHSHPSSAEVKNAWGYTFTPPTRLHGVVLS